MFLRFSNGQPGMQHAGKGAQEDNIMKAYVLIARDKRAIGPSVSVHWSNTECADRIIELANARLTDGSHVDSLGIALRALDNLGVDVNTYPVECAPPVVAFDSVTEVADAPIKEVAVTEQRDFDAALSDFLMSIRELIHAHYNKNFPSLIPPAISVDPNGKKYVRIVRADTSHVSVYCFVERATGDILKADGWKRPAKNAARGSIYENAGKDAITPYGVHYLRKRA